MISHILWRVFLTCHFLLQITFVVSEPLNVTAAGCPPGYYVDGDGECKVINSPGPVEKKFGTSCHVSADGYVTCECPSEPMYTLNSGNPLNCPICPQCLPKPVVSSIPENSGKSTCGICPVGYYREVEAFEGNCCGLCLQTQGPEDSSAKERMFGTSCSVTSNGHITCDLPNNSETVFGGSVSPESGDGDGPAAGRKINSDSAQTQFQSSPCNCQCSDTGDGREHTVIIWLLASLNALVAFLIILMIIYLWKRWTALSPKHRNNRTIQDIVTRGRTSSGKGAWKWLYENEGNKIVANGGGEFTSLTEEKVNHN